MEEKNVERSEWEMLFPGEHEWNVDEKKIVHIKELSWEQVAAVTKELAALLKDVTRIVNKDISDKTTVGELVGMGAVRILSGALELAPQRLQRLVALGTDIPEEIIPDLKAKFIPMAVLKIFEYNKELGESFFDLGGKMGMTRKKGMQDGGKPAAAPSSESLQDLSEVDSTKGVSGD